MIAFSTEIEAFKLFKSQVCQLSTQCMWLQPRSVPLTYPNIVLTSRLKFHSKMQSTLSSLFFRLPLPPTNTEIGEQVCLLDVFFHLACFYYRNFLSSTTQGLPAQHCRQFANKHHIASPRMWACQWSIVWKPGAVGIGLRTPTPPI